MPAEWTGTGWVLRHPPPDDQLPPGRLDSEHPHWTLRWTQAGWDAAAADPRHHTLVMRDAFLAGRRPGPEQLGWFRLGIAQHRAGNPRPVLHTTDQGGS